MTNLNIFDTEGLLRQSNMKSGRLSDAESDEESIIKYTELELERRHLKDVPVQTGHKERLPPCYVLVAAAMASLGGVLFGYDIGKSQIHSPNIMWLVL